LRWCWFSGLWHRLRRREAKTCETVRMPMREPILSGKETSSEYVFVAVVWGRRRLPGTHFLMPFCFWFCREEKCNSCWCGLSCWLSREKGVSVSAMELPIGSCFLGCVLWTRDGCLTIPPALSKCYNPCSIRNVCSR
jgi:hypothetical protein